MKIISKLWLFYLLCSCLSAKGQIIITKTTEIDSIKSALIGFWIRAKYDSLNGRFVPNHDTLKINRKYIFKQKGKFNRIEYSNIYFEETSTQKGRWKIIKMADNKMILILDKIRIKNRKVKLPPGSKLSPSARKNQFEKGYMEYYEFAIDKDILAFSSKSDKPIGQNTKLGQYFFMKIKK